MKSISLEEEMRRLSMMRLVLDGAISLSAAAELLGVSRQYLSAQIRRERAQGIPETLSKEILMRRRRAAYRTKILRDPIMSALYAMLSADPSLTTRQCQERLQEMGISMYMEKVLYKKKSILKVLQDTGSDKAIKKTTK